MSEKVEVDKTLIKLKKNNYDLNELTSEELETLPPVIIEIINDMRKAGSKSQERVYSTIDRAIDIYAEQLKDPNLSREERDDLNDRIKGMVEIGCQKDSEFKRWTFALAVSGVAILKNPEMRKAGKAALKLLNKDKPI
ncbi:MULTISPECIES: hypothetical protein [Peribacillus]|uniref:hypothetical protein n=1 Tax=Peribacillus TaxID=2675229 RepID=UPI000BA51507|nr:MULTISPECIES: hypothetical protein [Peribacillus]MBD8591240.1 hypothetical protein [Peribacillus simplex]MCM3170356.1 hypothetical protein [Peribacillus frigoritolerans]MEE3955788.1 hypothetical protein [Peribacillus frigoritolerans]PAL14715.1 hypothetical protein B8W99_04635 [Peribacillus simplex]